LPEIPSSATTASGTAGRAAGQQKFPEFPAGRDKRKKATQLARVKACPLKLLFCLKIDYDLYLSGQVAL